MPKKIRLTRGYFSIVDDEDFEELNKFKWYANVHKSKNGEVAAAVRTIRIPKNGKILRKMLYMHREILNAPKGMVVDHINHDPLDNRKENLRIVTHRQNHQNRANPGSSEYPGVYWDKQRDKWTAHIQINGTIKVLGRFESEKDAFQAYKTAVHSLGEKLVDEVASEVI